MPAPMSRSLPATAFACAMSSGAAWVFMVISSVERPPATALSTVGPSWSRVTPRRIPISGFCRNRPRFMGALVKRGNDAYRLAFLRFAQYAFIRLEIASLSAALHVGFFVRVVLGLRGEPVAFALGFRFFRLGFGLGFGLAVA